MSDKLQIMRVQTLHTFRHVAVKISECALDYYDDA